APYEEEHCHEYGQHQVVHDHVGPERQETEKTAARYSLQAVFAARERCFQAHEVHELTERQSDHGEVDPVAAYGEVADHGTKQSRDHDASEDGERKSRPMRRDDP